MAAAARVPSVIAMASPKEPNQRSGRRSTVFADLRRDNEYAARVARLLEGKRKRHVEQVLQFQRKHRIHQAR